MSRIAVALVLAAAVFTASASQAAPVARFTVTRSSGTAPLAVLFDAGTSSDGAVARPFHDLKYEWDFGDPDSGTWDVATVANASRNYELGPITGHLFAPAKAAYANGQATFTVTLTVTNAQGEKDTATQVITVDDPDVTYSGTATTCVSASGNFTGCPSGARRTTSSNFNASLVNSPGSRTLYRRGDTFSQSGVSLANTASAPSQIGAFGSSSARPIVTSNLAVGSVALTVGNGWTVAGLHFVGNGGTSHARPAGAAISRVTLYDLRAQGFHQCATWHSPSAPSYPTEISVVDFTCTDGVGAGSAYFGRNVRSMFLGLHIDVNQAGSSEFAWRSVHLDTVAIQHSYFTGTTNGRTSINFRACDQADSTCTGPQQRVVFSDNHVHQTDGSGEFLRFCGHDECTFGVPQTQTQDFLIERNYWSADYGMPGSEADFLQRGIQLQGRDMTIRNNVMNLENVPSGPPMRLIVLSEMAGLSFDRIHVLNNTFYMGQGWSSDTTICSGSAGSDKRCQGNLLYAPGITGSRTVAAGSWTTSGSLMDGGTGSGRYLGNPFASSTFTKVGDFHLSGSVSGGTSPVNAAGATGVLLDVFRGCRQGARDAGAHEFGSSPCPPVPPPPPSGLQPPEPPILLP